jgi:hypothetical protein
MTVGELMDILSKKDKNTLVLVNGYENGYDNVSDVKDVKVFKKGRYASWEGRYGDHDYEKKGKGDMEDYEAVLISRGGAYV